MLSTETLAEVIWVALSKGITGALLFQVMRDRGYAPEQLAETMALMMEKYGGRGDEKS